LPIGCPPVEIQIRDWKNHFRAEDGDLRHATYKLKKRKHLFKNDRALANIWAFWLNTWVKELLGHQTTIRIDDGHIINLSKKPKILDILHNIGKLKHNLKITATRNNLKLDETKHLITGDVIKIISEEKVTNSYYSSSLYCASHLEARQWLINTLHQPVHGISTPVIDYADELINKLFAKRGLSGAFRKSLLKGRDKNEICLKVAQYGPENAWDNYLNEYFEQEKEKRGVFLDRLNDELKKLIVKAMIGSGKRENVFFATEMAENTTVADNNSSDVNDKRSTIRFNYYGELKNFHRTGFIPKPIHNAPDQFAVAMCCNPIPKDKLTGYISKDSKFVVVHRRDCFWVKSAASNEPKRRWNYEWQNWENKNYDLGIEVFTIAGSDIQQKITNIFTEKHVKINKTISMVFRESATKLYCFGLEAHTGRQISGVLRKIQKISIVVKAQRSIHPNLMAFFMNEYDVLSKTIWNVLENMK